ncbi:hypothetical protein N7490_002034 [Penicillium lividum]|nr:hypothetical protein N7490_002034 [Penicillium lividum]
MQSMQNTTMINLAREELLEAFHRATAELKLCPNRLWSIAGEDLLNLLPRSKSMPSSLPKRRGNVNQGEQNNHELCTFDFCEHSQRDFTAIQQRHECKDADCMPLRGWFPRGILNEAASHGKSTVWSIAGNAMLEPPRPYMAVSHVWSDGTGAGAWLDRGVNKCLYDFFRGIAEQFQCEGIWWDTICIPREKAARNKAIENIQSNYQDARITLVHDCFLRNWDWDPETACFAILMSPWFSRGWTALELAKSYKVKVIFKGRHGPVVKDLDEEILAKESDPDSPRKEASRIIKNLRKDITSLNDLLTVLGTRYTSWPKDRATISALLVGVMPDERQQITYMKILRKIGRLSPGHLFHNNATMSAGFSWCPTSLFNMPLDVSSDASLVIYEYGIKGKWRIKHMEATLESNCLWDFSHPLIKHMLQDALKYPEQCWLLAKCGTKPVKEALLVREIQEAQYQYVGVLYFRQELTADDINDWIEKEVIISSALNNKTVTSQYPQNEVKEDNNHTIRCDTNLLEEKQSEPSGAEELRRAVWRRDYMIVSELGRKAELHIPDPLGWLPLHLAAERGDKQMVELLLEEADLNAKCHNGQTALHRASWGGSAATVELLLDRCSVNNAEDKDNNIALHIAAQMGFESVVGLLINNNTPVDAKGCNKLTALHYAAMNGHKEVARLLLNMGADVNAEDDKIGWTPLHLAAANGDEDLVKLLVTNGADLQKTDPKVGWTPLLFAAMNGSNEALHWLVKNGAKCEVKDRYGWTPRQFAESNGHREAVEFLSTEDNNTSGTKTHWTPLHCIAIDSQKKLFKLLASSDAVFNHHDKDESWSPLLFAANNGLRAPIERMLHEGADLEMKDDSGQTPLLWAVSKGHQTVVELLLEKGAKINAKGAYNLTPIMQGAREGHVGVVELLLKKGARVEGENKNFPGPLSWAAMMGHWSVVELLIEEGAMVEGYEHKRYRTDASESDWSTEVSSEEGSDDEGNDHKQSDPRKREIKNPYRRDGGKTGDDSDEKPSYDFDEKRLSFRISTKRDRLQLSFSDSSSSDWPSLESESPDSGSPDSGAVASQYDMTPLSWAARMGHQAVVELLLQKGATMRMDSRGKTPLSWAAKEGHIGVVELLLQKGARIEMKDEHYRTPLSWAAKEGHIGVVELLLQKGAKIEAKDDDDRTPLFWAAKKGHGAVVELLVQKGAKVELKDTGDMTPLSWAILRGHKDMVRLLLQKGANLELNDEGDMSMLTYAISKGYHDIVDLLLQNDVNIEAVDSSGLTLLTCAVFAQQHAIFELLLQKGANMEVHVTEQRLTPLILGTIMGDKIFVSLLLQNGANTEAEDDHGRTPLSHAAERGGLEVAAMLLQNNANVEAEDKIGQTPLSWAARKGNETMATILLQNNANVEAQDKFGRTPLLYAVFRGHNSTIKLLLQNNAKVNAKDNYGQTSLSRAAKNGDEAIVIMLLQNNANVELEDHLGLTPLSHASNRKHKSVVRLLHEITKIEAEDKTGRTPLSLALLEEHELLLEKRSNPVELVPTVDPTPIDSITEPPRDDDDSDLEPLDSIGESLGDPTIRELREKEKNMLMTARLLKRIEELEKQVKKQTSKRPREGTDSDSDRNGHVHKKDLKLPDLKKPFTLHFSL